MTMTPHRRALLVVIVVIFVQVAVFLLVWQSARTPQLHRVPVAVAAPFIVADALVSDVNSMAGRPFDARVVATAADGRSDVRAGRVVAAVSVDLAGTVDTVYVGGANGRTLIAAVTDRLSAIEKSNGRMVRVQDLVPAKYPDGQRPLRLLALLANVVGFMYAAEIAVRKGVRASTLASGVKRLMWLGALSVGSGLVGMLLVGATSGAPTLTVWAISALTVFAAGSATMALQNFFGLAGIGAAATLLLLLAIPVYLATSPLLLPQPWPTLTGWFPHGASLSALVAVVYFGGSAALKPVLILAAWIILSIGTLALSRHERAGTGAG